MAYAIVALPSLSREQFANDSGVFLATNVPVGRLPIRVRRLGYQPLDTVIEVGPAAVRITLALERVATRLAGVVVRAHPPCIATGKDQIALVPELADVVAQLKINADQYRLLVDRYPLVYMMEVTESSRMKEDGHIRVETIYQRPVMAERLWKYKPGQVVVRAGRDHDFNVPTLVALANDDFLANHCFHYSGFTTDSVPLMRIEVVAADRLKEPDINGQIYVDTSSFQIRRTVFQLSKPPRLARNLIDFEVSTEFREILPSVSVISSVRAVQTMAPNAKLKYDQAYEEQRLVLYRFLKGSP